MAKAASLGRFAGGIVIQVCGKQIRENERLFAQRLCIYAEELCVRARVWVWVEDGLGRQRCGRAMCASRVRRVCQVKRMTREVHPLELR